MTVSEVAQAISLCPLLLLLLVVGRRGCLTQANEYYLTARGCVCRGSSIRKASGQVSTVVQGLLLNLEHKWRDTFREIMRSAAHDRGKVSNEGDLMLSVVIVFLSSCWRQWPSGSVLRPSDVALGLRSRGNWSWRKIDRQAWTSLSPTSQCSDLLYPDVTVRAHMAERKKVQKEKGLITGAQVQWMETDWAKSRLPKMKSEWHGSVLKSHCREET